MTESLPYRPCAGILLLNADNHIFVGQRIDQTQEAWQMPQGGIDDGESPLDAAYRELGEETGLARQHVGLLGETAGWLSYDLPPELVGKLWGGKYRGQRQKWFAMRFLGQDGDIVLETETPEFRVWQWAHPQDVPQLIVPFKRDLYLDVLREFAPLLVT